ncbi:sigma-54 dependent transcriptional regulator [Dyella sp. C11]|uniref:sigma 54-interacting transcriptional regulator n=1 Tax=Dyella sp. C11 TaxID=2126991 RepID=UPI000D643ACA|nr:sigma-54 dependent transcriptional regulator [Dyella sp. C11]
MDALAVALLTRSMAMATHFGTLSEVFLAQTVRLHGLLGACCYLRNRVGDQLCALAVANGSVAGMPSLDMSAQDNPLVYSLITGQRCHVDDMTCLVGIGEGFEALREHWPSARALWVVPLNNSQQQRIGVMAFLGSPQALRVLQNDALWQALFDAHESLFARLAEMVNAEESFRYEQTVRLKLEADRGDSRARRLLASEFVGESTLTQQIRSDLLRLADSSLSILITGETGSGKDHAAWLIHQASARGGPFVPVNCAAIPNELIEAELFGSVRGAYTGATQARQGLVAEAHGGTLFLDEIGDMPLALQSVLLRVLNEKKYRPVGATKERESDFRLICATHQPLPRRIREGQFREDLYYRIRQQALHLPSLRERPDDIQAIATHVLLKHNRERQSHVAGFSAAAKAWLHDQPFPGNVRELRSLVMAAAEQTAPGQLIDLNTLQTWMLPVDALTPHGAPAIGEQASLHPLLAMPRLAEAVDAFERLMIGSRLRQLNGSRSRAAQSLGMPKRTLAHKCQKWNLDRETDAP